MFADICTEYVMDMVGHFELPTSHINRETATREDIEYAIKLNTHCLAYYRKYIREMKNHLEQKLK